MKTEESRLKEAIGKRVAELRESDDGRAQQITMRMDDAGGTFEHFFRKNFFSLCENKPQKNAIA